jgi:hypothetical protein
MPDGSRVGRITSNTGHDAMVHDLACLSICYPGLRWRGGELLDAAGITDASATVRLRLHVELFGGLNRMWEHSLFSLRSAARKSTRTRPKGLSLYRDRIDLDELDADLQGDKLISYVIAQGCLDADAAAFRFSFGATDGFNETPVFTPFMTYDGDVNYKLDINQTRRYLPLQAQLNDYHFVSLSGFDLANQITSERYAQLRRASRFGTPIFGITALRLISYALGPVKQLNKR